MGDGRRRRGRADGARGGRLLRRGGVRRRGRRGGEQPHDAVVRERRRGGGDVPGAGERPGRRPVGPGEAQGTPVAVHARQVAPRGGRTGARHGHHRPGGPAADERRPQPAPGCGRRGVLEGRREEGVARPAPARRQRHGHRRGPGGGPGGRVRRRGLPACPGGHRVRQRRASRGARAQVPGRRPGVERVHPERDTEDAGPEAAPRRPRRQGRDAQGVEAHRRHEPPGTAERVRLGRLAGRVLGQPWRRGDPRRGLPADIEPPGRGRDGGEVLAAHPRRAGGPERVRPGAEAEGVRRGRFDQPRVLRPGGRRRRLRAALRREAREARQARRQGGGDRRDPGEGEAGHEDCSDEEELSSRGGSVVLRRTAEVGNKLNV
mmetsp:Transcript_24042/g.56949  ORF Transcript_24042/g.56949 Transcript_24042/m.56949 type:complete len:376 (-) Transcript_24042:43-1170(-)